MSSLLQKAHQMCSEMCSAWSKNLENTILDAFWKRQQNEKQKTTQTTPKNIPPRVSHERGLRISTVHQGGPLGSLGSTTSPTHPQDASRPRSVAHVCVPSGLIWHRFVVRFVVHIKKTIANSVLIGVRSGIQFFDKTSEIALAHSCHSIHILGTMAGLPKAIGYKVCINIYFLKRPRATVDIEENRSHYHELSWLCGHTFPVQFSLVGWPIMPLITGLKPLITRLKLFRQSNDW